jgi:hypothetical protein
MNARKYPATKDRRDIGEVVFPIEKMMAARALRSSCVGVEALLEMNSRSINRRTRRTGRYPVLDDSSRVGGLSARSRTRRHQSGEHDGILSGYYGQKR